MGAWSELDTEISVDVDTSDLEKILDLDDIFEPVKETAERLIRNIHDGSKEAVKDIARRNKSFQEQIIAVSCKNPTGMLQSSIQEEEINNGYGFIVGTIIKHIYPMSIEYGHKDIYPIRAKALVFAPPPNWSGPVVLKGKFAGKVVLSKVNATEPRPFVAPAYEMTKQIAEEIMLRKVEIAKQRM